jgi:hypothetical protein
VILIWASVRQLLISASLPSELWMPAFNVRSSERVSIVGRDQTGLLAVDTDKSSVELEDFDFITAPRTKIDLPT